MAILIPIAAFSRLLCGILLFVALAPAHAGSSEYEVKAAFIHNIAKFVDWPAGQHSANTLTLCVLGKNPFGNALDALHDKQIGDRRWAVAQANAQTNLKECAALFIAASESDDLDWVLDDIRDNATLTFGDTRGYAKRGVMVNFYMDGDKVRFEFNPESANRARLKFSSKLIRVSKLIEAPK